MRTSWMRHALSCSTRMNGRMLLHTGKSQPAMPATKSSPENQEHERDLKYGESQTPDAPDTRQRHEAPKFQPRRKPGITNFDDFMKVQEAWCNKLPLDEDPTVPQWVVKRPIRMHTDATIRKMYSNETMILMQRRYDWSPAGVRRWFERKQKAVAIERQKFIPLRHGILGPDLATGHFITHRGGRVKFVGHTEWFTDDEVLPKSFDENYLIERVDATKIDLRWEGLDNICNLYFLEELNLTNNKEMDVWSFDKLCRQYRFSTKLKRMNVSGCTQFCERSLEIMHRIPSLEELVITDTGAAQYKFLELLTIMLHDIRPKLRIIV